MMLSSCRRTFFKQPHRVSLSRFNQTKCDANLLEFKPSTIIEPFRIKMVEPIGVTTRQERAINLKQSHYNVFKLHADTVILDLMTDSGTSAMSQEQWSKLLLGDESYARSKSWYKFEEAIISLTNKKYVTPVHQGRAAEKLLFGAILNKDNYKQQYVPGNAHFDTTRANIEYMGAKAIDFLTEHGRDPMNEDNFKGNIDIHKLTLFLDSIQNNLNKTEHITDIVPLIILTITNNTGGGQPVSMQNMYQLKEISNKYNIPLFVDCARFAENAWFIQQREPEQKNRKCVEIAHEFFNLFDGCLMSMKKDALSNIGGFLAINDEILHSKMQVMEILTEGFPTYGGLAGRDLEASAQGLYEILDERYLQYRMASIQYLYDELDKANCPMLRPCGGHAVYLNSLQFFDHIHPEDLPGQSLSCALYLEGGIRCVEIGTAMFGKTNKENGKQIPKEDGLDLVRLAIPRRVYTQSHFDYLIEVVKYVYKNRLNYGGYRIIKEPSILRHFTCDFELL